MGHIFLFLHFLSNFILCLDCGNFPLLQKILTFFFFLKQAFNWTQRQTFVSWWQLHSLLRLSLGLAAPIQVWFWNFDRISIQNLGHSLYGLSVFSTFFLCTANGSDCAELCRLVIQDINTFLAIPHEADKACHQSRSQGKRMSACSSSTYQLLSRIYYCCLLSRTFV